MTHIVVVGAGQAGLALIVRLRRNGFDGRITLVGVEDLPPYQRPPLSKAYLMGCMERERLYFRPLSWFKDHDVDLRTGTRVTAVHRAARQVELGGCMLSYEQLVLATGAVPRRLPSALGGDLRGVHSVRTLRDIDGLAADFRPGARLLILGGGYIGLEAAAVAVQSGLNVMLLEREKRILQRVAAPETSEYFRDLHTSRGVTIREGIRLERLIGEGRVSGAVLSDGSEVMVDLVIVGVGVLPDAALAERAGLKIDNGIACDVYGHTSDPHIWAAGDCASFPFQDQRLRLESAPNATDMAECVADNLMGRERSYEPKPWFWSDQYDVKLQIAGLNTGYDRVVVRRGTEGACSHWYYRGGQLIAVDAMNETRGYMVGKRLIDAGRNVAPDVVAASGTDLRSFLAAT